MGIDGSGTSCTLARMIRVASRSRTTAPSIFDELAHAGRAEVDVEGEAAGAEGLDGAVVAEDEQGAGASAQDALEPVAQRGTGATVARTARRMASRSTFLSSRAAAAIGFRLP